MASRGTPDPFPAGYDPAALANLLSHGAAETRHRLARELVANADESMWALLAATVHSAEHWRIRARCLELLGMAAGQARRDLAEQILDAVCRTAGPER